VSAWGRVVGEERVKECMDMYKFKIEDALYYASDEISSFIYASKGGLTHVTDIGEKVGKYIDGVPVFFDKV